VGSSAQLYQMAQWMAGHFSNFEQAIAQPMYFAYIHVYQCPLPGHVWGEEGLGFYVEQSYDIYPNAPYRQRVLHLKDEQTAAGSLISIQNYALKDPEPWAGSGRDLDRLQKLTVDDLEPLCGCVTTVQWTGTLFRGQSIPGKTCLVFRKDRQTYLHSEFEIAETHFRSLDQGRDPETDKVIWGSLSGPFEFVQQENFAQHVDPQLRLEPIH